MKSYAHVEEKKLTIMPTWKKGNNYAHVEEK